MIDVSDIDITIQHEQVVNAFKNDSSNVILESSFVKRSFPVLEERMKRTYPYEVRIPRSIPEMLDGDFSPARVITIEKPIEGPYSNIWFGDSSKGIMLPCGYKNGDSRYVNDVELGDKYVHGIMAGATGQGKSVTLNAIIYGICMLYGPWDVHMTLSDPKIVEFKSIAMSHPMPHIETVAATEDVDYLLSILQQKEDEMVKINSVFTKASDVFHEEIKKIEDFRKITGLSLPQNLLIFDEFQTMFKRAAKLAPIVVSVIDSFARLGRNTGYHLFLASQEVGTDIPAATLNNISMRAAMGCAANVSEMLLGNDGAVENLGRKGRLIFNLNSQAGLKEDNSLVVVPLLTGSMSTEISDSLIQRGHELDVTPVLQFYDEQDVLFEKDYKKFVMGKDANWSTIYLGEPSFVMKDAEQCVRLEMDGRDTENICVLTPTNQNLKRYFKMFKYNIMRDTSVNNLAMIINPMFEDPEFGAQELSDKFVIAENDWETSTVISVASNVLYKRILCLKVDKQVFVNPQITENSDKIFYSIVEKGSKYDTEIFRSRCCYAINLLNTDKLIMNGLKINNDNKMNYIKQMFPMYEKCNSLDTKITIEKMDPVFVWMLGVDRLLGIGRDSKTKFVNELKKFLQDGQQANVRFLMFTQTFDEVTDLKSSFKWYVLDGIPSSEQQKIKCQDDYPEQVGKVLGVLYTSSGEKRGCVKFKKMFLDGELAI